MMPGWCLPALSALSVPAAAPASVSSACRMWRPWRCRRPGRADNAASRSVSRRELNNPVLTLNLTRSSGEPAYLTVRQLVRNPPSWDYLGRQVFVCENPAVVAVAADELG